MTENPTESAASARFSAYDMAPIGICIVESETEAPVIRYTNGAFLYLVTAENDDPSEGDPIDDEVEDEYVDESNDADD